MGVDQVDLNITITKCESRPRTVDLYTLYLPLQIPEGCLSVYKLAKPYVKPKSIAYPKFSTVLRFIAIEYLRVGSIIECQILKE